MAGFQLIIYGRFWVITEDSFHSLKGNRGKSTVSRDNKPTPA